jgi:lipopolysaccharide export system permease protein
VKTLHIYLTRQVLSATLVTVMVFTFMLLLGNVLREILALLVNRQANLWTVFNAVGLLIPFVLVFALPMGLLTATLLTFGRFSADNELTAARAGGISLVSLITPILLLAFGMSCLCAMINTQVAPQCRVAYKKLLAGIGIKSASALITDKTFIKDFAGYIVYIDQVSGDQLKDVLIYDLEGDKIGTCIRAATGRYEIDPTNHTLRVVLQDAWRVGLANGRRSALYVGEFERANVPLAKPKEEPTKLTDMTFFQLQEQLRQLEKHVGEALPYFKGATNQPPASLRPMNIRSTDLTLPLRVQMHRQISFSFACIGFTLVGIPLGLRAHRRETTFGMAVALILVAVYYSFFILGQAFETRPEFAPCLILWLPNFLFQIVGMVLLWRANRGV